MVLPLSSVDEIASIYAPGGRFGSSIKVGRTLLNSRFYGVPSPSVGEEFAPFVDADYSSSPVGGELQNEAKIRGFLSGFLTSGNARQPQDSKRRTYSALAYCDP